jgi:hypothetical protein
VPIVISWLVNGEMTPAIVCETFIGEPLTVAGAASCKYLILVNLLFILDLQQC